jgi:ferredoxin
MDCAKVCPVDCFMVGPNFVVIDPNECIDCALCEPECPVHAIYSEDNLPEHYQAFIHLNAELAQQWPVAGEAGGPLPDADHWKDVADKLQFLEK